MTNNLSFETIRILCMENDWYTCGTNEDFENLQDMVDSGKVDIDDIVMDIVLHSDNVHFSDVKNIIEKYNNTKLTDTDKAKQIIERTNFNADYDVIEESLIPLKEFSVDSIYNAIIRIFNDMVAKRKPIGRLEMYCYDVNDINYLLFDNKNADLKQLEIDISNMVDVMRKMEWSNIDSGYNDNFTL